MAPEYIDDDRFLLHTPTARELYRRYAAGAPLIDYHTHLSAADIAANRRFATLFEIWLEEDHYKWRAMRAHGIDERFCTGTADPFEKFTAWAATVPHTLRNPLHHFTHLELRRYFDIDTLLGPSTAEDIWRRANARLRDDDRSVHGILGDFRVEVVCTTDDPADSLDAHESARNSGLTTRVLPTFRPDRALEVDRGSRFTGWLDRLGAAADTDIATFPDLIDALGRRHEAFHAIGCRMSDHGLTTCYHDWCDERTASGIFDKARAGQPVDAADQRAFASFMMLFFGRLDAARGWTKQLHIGARRNASTRAYAHHGADSGHDSIGDWPQIDALGAYLDALDRENALPRMVLYNVNPAANYAFATMAGNFQDGSMAGKVQFGSGWWFLDQREGIEWQLNTLSSVGLLSHFVGMTTDSRSFMSFPRHEYFRRILCNLIGTDIERGEIPADDELVGRLIENVCYGNARRYLGLVQTDWPGEQQP